VARCQNTNQPQDVNPILTLLARIRRGWVNLVFHEPFWPPLLQVEPLHKFAVLLIACTLVSMMCLLQVVPLFAMLTFAPRVLSALHLGSDTL
jgi:hypothetical protein